MSVGRSRGPSLPQEPLVAAAVPDTQLELERKALEEEQRALQERRAAKVAAKKQPSMASADADPTLTETGAFGEEEPSLSLPAPRKSIAGEALPPRAFRRTSTANAQTAPTNLPPPAPMLPPPPPDKPPPEVLQKRPSRVVQTSLTAREEVDVLRERMEAEQAALHKKREEREARRLARQMELAEATQGAPEVAVAAPHPPPPLKTRGRQMSDFI